VKKNIRDAYKKDGESIVEMLIKKMEKVY